MLEYCPDCFSTELEEYDEYVECMNCGVRYTIDSDQDYPEEYETDEYDEYDED